MLSLALMQKLKPKKALPLQPEALALASVALSWQPMALLRDM